MTFSPEQRAGRTPPGARRAILLLWVLHKPLLQSLAKTQFHFMDTTVMTASLEISFQRAVAKLALPSKSSTRQVYQPQSLPEKAKLCCVKSIQAHLSCSYLLFKNFKLCSHLLNAAPVTLPWRSPNNKRVLLFQRIQKGLQRQTAKLLNRHSLHEKEKKNPLKLLKRGLPFTCSCFNYIHWITNPYYYGKVWLKLFFALKVEIPSRGTQQTVPLERKLCSLDGLSLEGVKDTHNTGTTLNCASHWNSATALCRLCLFVTALDSSPLD